MPQLEITTYLTQTTWTIIIFIIYYIIMKQYIMPSILEKLYIINKKTSIKKVSNSGNVLDTSNKTKTFFY